MSCDHPTGDRSEFTWSMTAADDLWAHEHGGSEKRGGRARGWQEGRITLSLFSASELKLFM